MHKLSLEYSQFPQTLGGRRVTFTICGIYGGSFLDDVGVGLKIFRTFSKMAAPHPSPVINYQAPSTISSGNFSVNSKNILMILTSELSVFPRSHEKQ